MNLLRKRQAVKENRKEVEELEGMTEAELSVLMNKMMLSTAGVETKEQYISKIVSAQLQALL